jgi:hypothetical protein
MIVGRSMIVGHGPGAYRGRDPDFDELIELTTGAEEPAEGGSHHPGAHHPGMHHPGMHPHARGLPVAYSRAEQPQVVEEHPTHTREFPIGFTAANPIPANTTQQVEVKPQVLFRGERLAVPNSIVLNFQVADIKVGKDSQLASPGNMPAECFSNVSVGVRMQLDTAEPGITITLFMFNSDPNNAHPFSSVLYGTVIE